MATEGVVGSTISAPAKASLYSVMVVMWTSDVTLAGKSLLGGRGVGVSIWRGKLN